MNSLLRRTVFLAVLFFTASFSLPAQSNSPDAPLSGTLLDSSGAGVPNVRITAQPEAAPNLPVTATSANDGSYLLSLPAGRYRLQFTHESFVPHDVTLDLSVGQTRKLDLRLELERLSSSVVVTSQAEPALAQETSDAVTVVTREEIEKRQAVSLTDVILYTPGISIDRTGPEGGLAGIFINGGNSYDTKVLVDGTTVNLPGGTFDFSNFTLDNIVTYKKSLGSSHKVDATFLYSIEKNTTEG